VRAAALEIGGCGALQNRVGRWVASRKGSAIVSKRLRYVGHAVQLVVSVDLETLPTTRLMFALHDCSSRCTLIELFFSGFRLLTPSGTKNIVKEIGKRHHMLKD
jgi:hypothetical protein